YGPTETTVGACTYVVAESSARDVAGSAPGGIPIGVPLPNVRAYVLDRGRRLAPQNEPGELWIGGPGVAAGYLYREDLTAERFVVDPFVTDPNARMYRTGDRVRRLPSGDLEFLGRLDAQVKIRGHRVELGEIEACLVAGEAIAAAAAVLFRTSAGEARIVAYVVLEPNAAPHEDRVAHVRATLEERLPEHMLPSDIVILERLPLTPSGKVDRAALPDPQSEHEEAGVAPRNATEAAVAEIWAEVLGRDAVGIHDDFLVLGGHSILAIRVLGKISRRLGVKLSLRAFFEGATVARIAEAVDRSAASRV
ncbi:MAG: AMP-binding protein, partial [Candidatus Eremiobacteraeota bacterium]|nr:AMP-binding protein [Candidatus Eremiobacteraeota bacterium]